MIEKLLPEWSNAGAVLMLVCTLIFYYWHQRPIHFPPGPRGFPLIGVLPYLGKYPERTMQLWSRKYGPVMSVRIGSEDWVVMGDQESIYQSFVKGGNVFSGRPYMKVANEVTECKGLAMIDFNPTWKTQRKFGHVTLRGFGVGKKSLEERIIEEVEAVKKNILSKEGKPFDITDTLTNAIMNVICNITAGQRFEYDDQFFLQIRRHLWFMDPDRTAAFSAMVFVPLLCHIPPYRKKYEQIKQDTKEMMGLFRQLVDQHRKTFDKNNLRDFIDAFILENENGTDESFTDQQLVHYVRELFKAGTETSTGTLRWAMLCLIHYPEAQEKIRREIYDVLGNSTFPSMSDRNAMPYTSAFIQEVFRFRTLAPLGVPHKTTDTVNFANYIIPKGTKILPNLWAVHNDPTVWDNPRQFKPERHIDDKEKYVQSNHVIPFSVGPRHCLGEQLARMEIFIFLVSMIQKFEFLPDPNKTDLPGLDDGVNGVAFVPYPFKLVAKEI
ncbi:cytochrome P450 2U1-like [Ciona intestinalis]